MNKEEIEELKDFTIDLINIDELALGLEVCSKKSNMVIQEFADTIIQLQQENKQLQERIEYLERSNNRREDTIIEQRQEISDLEDNWNKLKEYIRKNIIYDDVGMKILDPSPLEDYMQELEGSDSNE